MELDPTYPEIIPDFNDTEARTTYLRGVLDEVVQAQVRYNTGSIPAVTSHMPDSPPVYPTDSPSPVETPAAPRVATAEQPEGPNPQPEEVAIANPPEAPYPAGEILGQAPEAPAAEEPADPSIPPPRGLHRSGGRSRLSRPALATLATTALVFGVPTLGTGVALNDPARGAVIDVFQGIKNRMQP